MSGSWPKIVRDPVHNIIPFEDNDCDRLLLDLINTKEFQRLRRIKQLGVSQLVFPGADHSRFAHSIGVMQIARSFLERIEKLSPGQVEGHQYLVVLVAALLHDLGHGPFSHAFEKITGEAHEQRTLEIITSPDTEVGKRLRKYSVTLPQRLRVFFDKTLEDEERDNASIPAFLTQIVTSQLDADRFDYLLRDSYSTGTDYGRFDIAWLMQHLNVDSEKGRFFLGHKALFAAESYVFARYHMYRSVYFHKTTRAAEVMLKLLFRRYKALLELCSNDAEKRNVVPDAPKTCVTAFQGKISLNEYLLLDDHTLTEFAKACLSANDSILKELSEGLLYRRLYKATEATNISGHRVSKFCDKVREILDTANIDKEYSFEHDAPSDTAYKLYNPDAEEPATQIYVADASGEQVELSQRTESVHELTKKYNLLRYYYPASVRDMIQNEAEPLLRRD